MTKSYLNLIWTHPKFLNKFHTRPKSIYIYPNLISFEDGAEWWKTYSIVILSINSIFDLKKKKKTKNKYRKKLEYVYIFKIN